MTSLERNRDVLVSHDVTMTLSAVTLLTLLYAGVTSAAPGESVRRKSISVIRTKWRIS